MGSGVCAMASKPAVGREGEISSWRGAGVARTGGGSWSAKTDSERPFICNFTNFTDYLQEDDVLCVQKNSS